MSHPNDGEVICKRCRRKLDRTDLNCYACGSKDLDRSRVVAEVDKEEVKQAQLWYFDGQALRYIPITPGSIVPPGTMVFDSGGKPVRLEPMQDSYSYKVPLKILQQQQKLNEIAYATACHQYQTIYVTYLSGESLTTGDAVEIRDGKVWRLR